jgi:uncharacterized protein
VNQIAATLVIAAILVLAQAARGDEQEDIAVTLPRAAATELREELAGARALEPLQLLGLQGVADYQPLMPVPMRDGIRLSANLILPHRAEGQKLPVILIRTPYSPGKEVSEHLATPLLARLVRSGYAIVIVNDRGTQWSEGHYHWLQGANQDGYDIMEWITRQSWANAKVGTFGCSSSAESQPPLATLNHPAHKAMVEMAGATAVGSVAGYHDQGIFYHGGVPDLAWSWWYRRFGLQEHPILPPGISDDTRARIAQNYSPEPAYGMADFLALASHLPTKDILRASGAPPTEWDRLIQLTPASPEWAGFDFIRDRDQTHVPGLHIDSWYDVIEAYPTTKLFQHFARGSPDQHLIMGPTAHCRMGTETQNTSVCDREVGDGRFDYVTMIARWFDRWLKDDRSTPELPAVQYYVLNASQWLTADSWPPRGGHAVRLFLRSSGHANSLSGDGRLSDKAPASAERADEFVDDPMHPVPSLGGSCCSERVAREQSGVETRQDVLVYSSDPFTHTTRIVGDVNVTLFVGSSAPDTDVMVKLIDVDADGHAYNLADTAARMRYRNGYQTPTLMQPGKTYSVTLTGIVTATDILRGHRLRIEIASSNFPNYERNLNSGGHNFDETQAALARNQILHTPGNLSFVEFTEQPR